MDFYESPNSHSQSSRSKQPHSNQSHNSNNSHKSHVSNSSSSNSFITKKLKYCASSSSLSSSSASTLNLIYDSAEKLRAHSSYQNARNTLSSPSVPVTTTQSQKVHRGTASCPNARVKRRRKSSASFDIQDPDVDFEPSAKRAHVRSTTPYKDDNGSVTSSVYPSSVGYLSDDISDVDDIVIVASTITSPSSCSSSSKLSHNCDYGDVQSTQSVECSATMSTTATHHGERTPAPPCQTPYDCMTPRPEPSRLCPLPALSWANADDVWHLMCKKDEIAACLRTASMLQRHPSLQFRMRAILLDWLIEVCEVYKLHRETYYLAVDYLDRYLSAKKNVQKTHLQLIGITCLFVAAKVEEIYPPKIGEFAYVTDGACTDSDILKQEVLLLQALEWRTSSVTPMSWLSIYMQLNINKRTPAMFKDCPYAESTKGKNGGDGEMSEYNNAFIYPQFSGMEFVQTAQLLDLCSLDTEISNYSYAVIAAAAMSHTFSRETAMRCSGMEWDLIQPCARWMDPFFEVVREESQYLKLTEQNEQIAMTFGLGHICPNIVTDDSHIIQTHTITMAMFDRVCLLQEHNRTMAAKAKQEASPATGLMCPEGLLTPPASSRKPPGSTTKGDVASHYADDDEDGIVDHVVEDANEPDTDIKANDDYSAYPGAKKGTRVTC